MRLWRFTCFLMLAFFLLGGCGYHFTGEGPGPKPGLQSIAIPVFENSTSEPDLGSMFAGALRREFLEKGHIKVVPVSEAEAIFRGRIAEIHTAAVAHHDFEKKSQNRLTIETRLYVTVDVKCQDVKSGKVLWQDPHFTYYRVYRQIPDPNLVNPNFPGAFPMNIASFENRRSALDFLAREMSIRIHDRFLSNF